MPQNIHLISNAHLDPIWLWRWQEGCNEALQTFRAALDRIKEEPSFVFTCSSASYYKWAEELEPAMFAEIQQAVQDGRWVPVNGWWVQPDCNLPSGESFARHALYSQLYFYEKFGRICKTGYNVDSFGHSAMIPQLLQQAGMTSYVMMRPQMHENAEIPENAFWWEGADGSRVLAFRIFNGYANAGKERLERCIEESLQRGEDTGHAMMLFCGTGNHGGGPGKADLAYLTEKMQQQGYETVKFSSPDAYFEELTGMELDLPVWKDDLQHHASGCYSAVSMVKQLNRKAEQALFAAEVFDTAAAKQFALPPATENLKQAWQDVCFNHFHDIMDGCCIMEAYDDFRDSMGHANTIAQRTSNNAMLQFSRKLNTWLPGCSDPTEELRHRSIPRKFPRPIVVFNALGFARKVPVQVNEASVYVEDAQHNPVPFQNVRGSRFSDPNPLDTYFLAEVPAMGYALHWIWLEKEDAPPACGAANGGETDGGIFIENEYLYAQFCPKTGAIAKLVNKQSGRTVNHAPMALPTVIRDIEADTWAHNIFTFHDIMGTMQLERIRIIESGPMRAMVEIKHNFGKSTLLQKFYLTAESRKLVCEAKAIWHEDFTTLKIPLPLQGTDEISTYEIPNGYIKRPCNGEEEPGQNWADLTVTDSEGKRHGVAVISDSKYSFDCPGTQLRLTALRNVIFADHCAARPDWAFNFTDEGLQRFTYAIYPHEGEAEESCVVREGADLNSPAIAVQESYHTGDLPAQMSLVNIDEANIQLTAYKFCEDGSGDVIVRCYESQGKPYTRAAITLPQLDAAFWADFARFEIKTFRIDSEGRAAQVNFMEGIVPQAGPPED